MNKFKYIAIGTVFAASLIIPLVSHALDYSGSGAVDNSQTVPQPRVLGAVTPSPDINGDGIVNSMDVALLVGHIGQHYPAADLNSDGKVDKDDLTILSSWWFAHR